MKDHDILPQNPATSTLEFKNQSTPSKSPKSPKIPFIIGITAAVLLIGGLTTGIIWSTSQKLPASDAPTSSATEEATTEPTDIFDETISTEHAHTEVLLEARSPTCKEAGLTEGKQCSECGEILVEQAVIPISDHTFGDWIVDRQPEPAVTGNRYRTCSLCDHIDSETLEALRYSQGLEYYSNGDGTCRVIHIGTCTDTDIAIPAMYKGEIVTSIEMGFPPNTTSVVIPSSVTQIRNYSFYSCDQLVEIENGVSYVNDWVIGVDPSFRDVTIREGTIGIADFSFSECTNITSITIPESVRYIGESAFDRCTGLTKINLPENLSRIHATTFSLCAALTSITIPSNVISIGESAFLGCSGLTEIVIPERVQTIEPGAFVLCTNLKTLTVHPDNEVYHSANNCVIETKAKTLVSGCRTSVIPSDGSVTSIDQRAFSGCTGLKSITIPDCITEIKSYAFDSCTGLTDVVIPDSVQQLGRGVFASCTGLTSVKISNKLTGISESLFSGCTSLRSIIIPDNIVSIHSGAFAGCTSLPSITISPKIKTIENHAFAGCSGLKDIYITDIEAWLNISSNAESSSLPNSNGGTLHIIDKNGNEVTELVIPDGVTSISNRAFYGCSNLTSIVVPDSVTSIGERAFYNCSKLTSIVIPDSVSSIGDKVFFVCRNLTDIYYTGTKSEWNAITKGTDWDSNTAPYTIHYNYTP